MTLENIGENDTALLCITDLTLGQQPNQPIIGSWFFPNGTKVHSNKTEWDFYRTRGQMVVRMNRGRGGEDGIYYCEIPDSTNVMQIIYIGVYTATTGE